MPRTRKGVETEFMILAPIKDPVLRATVQRAALPDEDVFVAMEDVREAVLLGFPRLLVCQESERVRLTGELRDAGVGVPLLGVAPATLRAWEMAWETDGFAVSPMDDSALRLRRLMEEAAGPSEWVEGVFADFSRLLGRGLPASLRGFSRRTLEFPAKYFSLAAMEAVTGLSGGALKARFRRRGLASPAAYLRWLRILAAGRFLARDEVTTLEASFRLGFASDGNFCRWVRSTAGLAPSDLRRPGARVALMVRMAEKCFPEGALDRWETLGDLFLRQVA